jgi:hypothetical protein
MGGMQQQITIRPGKVVKILALIVVLLVLASIAIKLLEFVTGRHHMYGLIRLFYLDNEANIPTFFSSVLLLISAVLLAMIAVGKKRMHDRYAINWVILAIIFFYLATDEAASLHEMFSSPVMDILSRPHEGVLWHLGWTIPFAALVVVFAVSYWKFLFHLPPVVKILLLTAAVFYVGGALGGEVVQILYGSMHGVEKLTYTMIITIEETLEMTGILIFIYALLKYMSPSVIELNFRFSEVR